MLYIGLEESHIQSEIPINKNQQKLWSRWSRYNQLNPPSFAIELNETKCLYLYFKSFQSICNYSIIVNKGNYGHVLK